MKIDAEVPLSQFTTFKLGGPARHFCSVADEAELVGAVQAAKELDEPFFILGGGSNILVSDDGFDGLVIKNEMKGIGNSENFNLRGERHSGRTGSQDEVLVAAAGGETWDDLVKYAVEHGLYGIENLSAIPGTVGAAPVQNIGAYGAEVGNAIVSVRALDTEDMKFKELSREECRFHYRDSMFKREKGRYVITAVMFALRKSGEPDISYDDLNRHFAGKPKPSLAEVRDAVVAIRERKLPDWRSWGTAGSYFKNPTVTAEKCAELARRYPGLPCYDAPNGMKKFSLAWVLDHVCKMKGITLGPVGTYDKQALVLVAKPGAKAVDIVALARRMMVSVLMATGVRIEAEVEWVN